MRSRGLPAAGRPRKENHTVGVSRYVLEAGHHASLPPTRVIRERNRGPQPGVQLPAKLLDQALFILAVFNVTLGDQHLAVSGLHSQEAHAGIMPKLTFPAVRVSGGLVDRALAVADVSDSGRISLTPAGSR